MNRSFLLFFVGILSACSTLGGPGRTAVEVVLLYGDLGGPPCRELGLIDIDLGRERLPDDCTCTRPYVKEVREDELNAAIAEAAAAKGGNTVWILRSWGNQSLLVHLEGCCFTSAQRAIGLVCRCKPDERAIAESRAELVERVRVP